MRGFHEILLVTCSFFVLLLCGCSEKFNTASLSSVSRSELKWSFRSSLENAKKEAGEGDYENAAKVLNNAGTDFLGVYGGDSAIGYLISGGIAEAKRSQSAKGSYDALNRAFEGAIKIADYNANVDAKLPEGFPDPSPEGMIVVKSYGSSRMAKVSGSADANNADAMFKQLFKHIKKNDISMTAPVEMEYEQRGGGLNVAGMGFYYPGMDVKGQATEPVKVVKSEPLTVVSLAVKGSYKDENFVPAFAKLEEWLKDNSDLWRQSGEKRVLAYNGPLTLWFMKNAEVQIAIEPR